MRELRIVVADDSSVMRRVVSEVIRTAPGMSVAGVARNGREAIEIVEREAPDALLLDIEMPEMDGLTALGLIRQRWPDLPVIMFSTLAQHGAKATVDALALGASDYVAKPTGGLNVGDTVSALREKVAPILEALCRRRVDKDLVPSTSTLDVRRACDAVVVGASTGGPAALGRMLAAVDANFPLPIVVVQHMPSTFTRHFAAQLDGRVPLPVREVTDPGDAVGPGVWIAPGGRHLGLVRRNENISFELTDGEPLHSVRPAADVLFESAAKALGPRVLAVVLTGMGVDGLVGCQAIRKAGGYVWVQNSESSVVWGMPGAIVKAGAAQTTGSPEELGHLLTLRGTGTQVSAVGS